MYNFNSLKNTLRSRKERTSEGGESWRNELQHSTTVLSGYDTRFDNGSPSPLPLSSSRTRSQDRRDEPLGLHVIQDPGGEPSVDIIFVHGLGGTSRLSWSWKRDLSLFWPKEWLPLEPELKEARILTFGYNAHFMSQTRDTFNVSDFAKDLLMQMKFGTDANAKPLNIGKVPLIFVVHSMGGLVVKKAYILGCQDPQYQDILDNVCSIVFLATPHRGSSLANILSKLLYVSFHSPKPYINDLMKNSQRISDINDQFRLHADKMQTVSFYETQPTNVGLKKVMVVERDSAILGYPSEISSPLNADHHTVCKYSSRQDANYISVRNVIKSLVEKFKLKGPRRRLSVDHLSLSSFQSVNEVMSRLGVEESPTEDLDLLLDRYVPGSCDWILRDESFTSFLDDQTVRPSVLHITGHPGAGKSVLASFLIRHLSEELEQRVQFWYFRYDDQAKRSIRQCLLSLALQMANCVPEYSQRLTSLMSDIDSITRFDNRSLWQKLFISILDNMGTVVGPVYWVIDAVDESESSQTFLGYLALLRQVNFPLRIVFLTRLQTVTRHFDKVKASLPPGRTFQVNMATPETSLALYIADELAYSPWSDVIKTKITNALLSKSQGNFLWLTLVLKKLADCDTVEDLEESLEETPWELVELYDRMETDLAHGLESKDLKGKKSEKDSRLRKAILAWVTCAERHVTVEELAEALRPDFGELLNLRSTISRLCGDFVVIDKKSRISMVHYTAKEYLTNSATSVLAIQSADCHTLIFARCLDILTDPRFRIRLKSQGCVGLLQYCCLLWSHHMVRSNSSGHGRDFVYKLAVFFRDRACLAWIEAVATTGHVRTLTSAAKDLTSYLENRRHIDDDMDAMMQPLLEAELISTWATDLVRVVGKFGTHLLQYPSCIYSLVPLFCPPDSAVGRQFSVKKSPTSPAITGISNTAWDDCLATFVVGHGTEPEAVHASDNSFAIVTSDKTVNLYHSATFQEARRFHHNEIILVAKFSREGDKLVTCGTETIKIWDTTSTQARHTFSNPNRVQAMAVSFSGDSTEIIICCDESSLWRQRLDEPEHWIPVICQQWDAQQWDAPDRGRGAPVCTSFSPDGSQVAIVFRGTVISCWGTEKGNLIGRCERVRGNGKNRDERFGYPTRLTWNPVTEHVLGIYNEGAIFKWYPLDREREEMDHSIIAGFATEIACSPDGRLVVMGQVDGSLKVFRFDNFSLLYNVFGMSRATALTVSVDGRRIYDLRESYCNVWEPNALISVAEQDEKASDTSISHYETSVANSHMSKASSVYLGPVTAVCVNPSTGAYAFGNDYSSVVTYLQPDGLASFKYRCGNIGIVCLAISNSGDYVAMASIDKTVAVRQLSSPSGSQDSPTPILTTKTENLLIQVLFDESAGYLLGMCHRYINVWRLPDPCPTATRPNDKEPCFWIAHPFSSAHFLSIGPAAIVSYRTADLLPTSRWSIDVAGVESTSCDVTSSLFRRLVQAHIMSRSEANVLFDKVLVDKVLVAPANVLFDKVLVDKVLVAPNKSRILVQTSRVSLQGKRDHQVMLLATDFLLPVPPSSQTTSSPALESPPTVILAQPLPKHVLELMEIPLGFVAEGARQGSRSTAAGRTDQSCSLAFIDRDFWVRTWSLNDTEGVGSKRHFFLPRDWINMDCLELAQVTADGRLLCPRNGEVAVVHNGLKIDWVE